MKHIAFTIFPFLLFNLAWCQNADVIINRFINVNEVQYQVIGYMESELYRDFEKLRDNSDLEFLVELTTHENPVVKCYASWALADRDFPHIDEIFKSFLIKDDTFTIHTLDMMDVESLSASLYHRYWNKLNQMGKENDAKLQQLDSIILYHPNPDWLLTLRALENRIYSRNYHPRIEELAFDEHNKSAIFYLSNWYRAEYQQMLKTALIEYLGKTDFATVGVTEYYQVVNELLNFRNEEVEEAILKKLKSDIHWESDKQRFVNLLHAHSIYKLDQQ